MEEERCKQYYTSLVSTALQKHLRNALLLNHNPAIVHSAFDRFLLSALTFLRNPPEDRTDDVSVSVSPSSRLQRNWGRPRHLGVPPVATSVPLPQDVASVARRIERNWIRFLPGALTRATMAAGEETVSGSNLVQVIPDSFGCLESMWRSIDAAKERVWLETFCFDESPPSRILLAKLRQAAQRGVEVCVSVDAVGSLGVGGSLRRAFAGCGDKVRIHQFNPPWRPIGPLVYRDHRKLLICDDVAYTGSLNFDWRALRLPPHYAGELAKAEQVLGKPPAIAVSRVLQWIFRDTSDTRPPDLNLHVALKGPCVNHLASTFRRGERHNQSFLLREERGLETVHHSLDLPDVPGAPKFSDCLVQVLKSDGRQPQEKNSYLHMLRACIKNAQESLVIASSYFHPPRKLRKPLAKTLRRGVPSCLILSGLSDVMFDTQATLAVLPYFLIGQRNMCRSFFIRRQHLHMKTVTVDSVWTSIGSFNFDRYSARRNLELGVAVCDPRVARFVNDQLEQQIIDKGGSGKGDSGEKGGVKGRELLREGTEEYTLDHASNLSLVTRLGGLISYHLVRATGASWLDGFVTKNTHKNL